MLKAALLAAVVLLAATFAQPQQLNSSLSPGQSLSNGQTLVSAQGTFVLGFFANGDSTYLGIWYMTDPRTVVWVANRDTPIKGANGSFNLTANSLVLLDIRGNNVWSSGTLDTNSPQAFLLDSGNLIIHDDSTSDSPLWQSFDKPCHTLLYGMKIGYDTYDNHYMQLTSWKSDSDPSSGDYHLRLDPRRLPDVLLFNGSKLIYRMGTWNGQGFSGLPVLKDTNELVFNMSVRAGSAYYSFTPLDRSVQWLLVMSQDGHAYRRRCSNSSNDWVEYFHYPNDRCDTYAYCGPNAVCQDGDCICLQEFAAKSMSDWNRRIYAAGCVRDANLSCSPGNGFNKLTHVKVPDTLNATLVEGKSLDDCRNLCLGNCSCTAYTILQESDCVVWSGDLVDIVQLSEGINDLYTRVSHITQSHTGRKTAIIVSVSVIGVLLVISVLLGFCYRRSQQKHAQLPHGELGTEHEHAPGPMLVASLEQKLGLDAIKVATNNFSEQNSIVSARMRTIYMGTLPNIGNLAIKRLNTEAGVDELKNEVSLLARLDHPNIIKMLGSCIGNNEKVICYEYMPGGSLDAVLFAKDERSRVPDWPSRFRIMQGISEGLLYLHEHCKIVHRDIDPSNILLSDSFIPKISDFGLATLLAQGQSEGKAENFRGTRGYSAPELFYGKYSVKSDVYSFGVVLLEIVTGCKATSFYRQDTDELPRYVRQHWTYGTADQLRDARMGDAPRGEVERCIHIGVRCVQDDPSVRPTMSYIRNALAAVGSVP